VDREPGDVSGRDQEHVRKHQLPVPPARAGEGAPFGPFVLAPGIAARNGATILFASFSTISLVTFLNFANPYVFELLQIPQQRQGALAGLLVSLQEGVQILIGGFIGAWSDRVGRRPVFVGGLLLMAAGYAVYPLAGSESALVALRAFYAVGSTAATVMMSTCIAEYIHERHRGRWMGTVGACNGIGVVTMATVFAKLPLAFAAAGLDDATALRASFWVFALAQLLLAALLQWGLAPPEPGTARARTGLLRQTLRGLTIARENPRIALSYLNAFASRGDLVIMTTFISLWVVQAGVTAGLSPGAATARAGMVFGAAQLMALAWAFVMGLILDRVDRLAGACLGFGLAAAGYTILGLVDDPLGSGMVATAMLAGIGEASAVVCAGVLIGQEAPAPVRGTVFGTFSLAGSFGMICLTFAGGQAFDAIAPGAPFLMMGAVNAVVVVATLALRARTTAQLPRAAQAVARPDDA
jgi:MFS family permease